MFEIDLKPSTYVVRVYDPDKGQSAAENSEYICAFLLVDLGMGQCRIQGATGKLTSEMNDQIAAKARDIGFDEILFEVPAETRATRLAEPDRTRKGITRYRIDLT